MTAPFPGLRRPVVVFLCVLRALGGKECVRVSSNHGGHGGKISCWFSGLTLRVLPPSLKLRRATVALREGGRVLRGGIGITQTCS
jgi:hypothetical protein